MVKKLTRNILIGAGILGALAIFGNKPQTEETALGGGGGVTFLRESAGGNSSPITFDIIPNESQPSNQGIPDTTSTSTPTGQSSQFTGSSEGGSQVFRNEAGEIVGVQDPSSQQSRLPTEQEQEQGFIATPQKSTSLRTTPAQLPFNIPDTRQSIDPARALIPKNPQPDSFGSIFRGLI